MNTYAIEAIGIGRVKIGKTENVFRRASTLQSSSPVKLRLIAASPADIEDRMHRALGRFRSHGEWFDLNKESRAIILQHMSTQTVLLSQIDPNAPNKRLSAIAASDNRRALHSFNNRPVRHTRTSRGIFDMPRPNRLGLSSRDSSSKTIGVRLPHHLDQMVRTACENQRTTPSEFLRALVEHWALPNQDAPGGLSGPDLGYAVARSKATQIAHKVLQDAIAALPSDAEELDAMLQEHHAERAEARRKS